MLRFNRLLACSALASLLLTLSVSGAIAQSQAESDKPDAVIENPDVVMHVTGLACEMCARSVTNSLMKIDRVRDVQVLLGNDQRILIILEEGAKVDNETLRGAVTSAGFSTRKVVFKGVQDPSS